MSVSPGSRVSPGHQQAVRSGGRVKKTLLAGFPNLVLKQMWPSNENIIKQTDLPIGLVDVIIYIYLARVLLICIYIIEPV